MEQPLDTVLARYPGAQTFKFGDNPVLCAELIDLVRRGQKRATCSFAPLDYVDAAPPEVGRCDIALDWEGTPAVVIRTLELRVVRFCDMPEDMALMEGQDASLASWRRQHRIYFERNGVFQPDMLLTWERFELVEDLADV